ncbi:cytochrome B [Novosphingobium flavum]|uniref:Cytochrome B n=2 Tax=Novosphingobium flavum TaxID=1778672 RepID=A0A7X1KL38_9SPHN|nr:cytochrome B [Novosphingobium flavum]
MVLAWAILVPLGIIAARYYKITPRQPWPQVLDNKAWWHAHRACQFAAMALATIGWWLAIRHARGETALAGLHGLIGWAVMILGWSQVAAGLLRGTKGGPTDPRAAPPHWHGDHYDMTRRRILFERGHKAAGYLVLALTLVAVPTGLVAADAPRWMAVVIAIWWAALAALAWRLQRAGRCVDTYQAIWGAGADLPGNKRRPIGWGVAPGSVWPQEN